LSGRKYQHPPIEEALCEIYFSGSVWDSTIPGIFYDRIKDRFPIKTQVKQVSLEVQLAQETPATKMIEGDQRGRFASTDNSRMVQITRDLLVINQLKPYPESFEDWKPLVLEMVKIYQEIAKPTGINQLGVRFINRIAIPEIKFEMEAYFRVYLHVPTELAPHHEAFLTRVNIPPQKSGHQLMISFGTAPTQQSGHQAFMLDIYDILPLGGKGRAEHLSDYLTDAHRNVEHAFESAITDNARALFKEIKKT
jgi:uncharacterized protein (TIGR04255 family)